MENIKLINKKLEKSFGKSITGEAVYRLVWSEDMREIRKGEFTFYSPAGLYLGTRIGTEEVRKYDYFKDRYVLEVFVPELQEMVKKATGELVKGDGYEPLFVFTNKNREYLKPEWWAIEYIIRRHREVVSHVEKRTEEMDKRVHNEEIEKEAEVFMDYLSQEQSSNWMNRFKYKEAVIIHKDKN